jgi:hypothetical protein
LKKREKKMAVSTIASTPPITTIRLLRIYLSSLRQVLSVMRTVRSGWS